MTQISQDTIKDLIVEEGVTDNELEVLVLALNGKLPADIKTILGRQSENAVQKTLSRIYTKFRISGAGPGKLSKLQNILLERLQAKQGKRKVLIAWAGSNGKHQAETIRDVIFKHPQIEAFILDIDRNLSSNWFSETEQFISNIDFGILCLPKEALEHTWINFLIGFFSGKIQNFRILRFNKKVNFETPIPYPSIDGTDKNNLADLLHEIIDGDVKEAKDWINYRISHSNWLDELAEEESNYQSQTEPSTTGTIIDTLEPILKNNSCYLKNQIFQQVIINDILCLEQRVEFFVSNGLVYKMPLELYPRHLTALQKKYQVCVKAVAIVKGVESFWASDKGDEIAKTANPESERLFVFSTEKDLEQSWDFILRHAAHYNVFVTTRDIYIPRAEEFSVRNISSQWNDGGVTLPTKEYAIIETSDGIHQLIVWYDEDNVKNPHSLREAYISPVKEYIEHYKAVISAFIRQADNEYGVVKIPAGQSNEEIKKVSQKLDQIKDSLFRKAPHHKSINPDDLLHELQDVRDRLGSLNNKDDVIYEALKLIRDKLKSQTASIYLFSKDGYLHRQKILGIDAQGNDIDDQWFKDEKYLPGESFTGKAAVPQNNKFGKSYSNNDLIGTPLDTESKKKYSQKLGGLYSAIVVPLNGRHKTYGVIEVINKCDSFNLKPILNRGFSEAEIYWLDTIGASVASAISNIRTKIQAKLLRDLSDSLVDFYIRPSNIEKAYRNVVERLISENTAFKVCILRVKGKDGLLKVVDRKGINEVSWKQRIDEPRGDDDGLVGKAIKFKKPVIIKGIDSKNITKFRNHNWVNINNFQSFGCFPLLYKEEVIGAISLYAGYEYDFHPGCLDFLDRVASLTAAFIGKIKELEQLDDMRKELDSLPANFTDLSHLQEKELRKQLSIFQKQWCAISQKLNTTFINPQSQSETKYSETSEENFQEIATKYYS
jgi:GAF domain-containing protein